MKDETKRGGMQHLITAMTIPSPYLIIYNRWMFDLVFIPQEGELFISQERLLRKENKMMRRFFPRQPELAYGADGMMYEVDFELLPEHLQLGEKSRDQFDWWDRLYDWYDRWFCGGGHKEVPVRYHFRNPQPYEYAELRARIAGILRKDGDCYSQFGADTQKAAQHIEKTKNYLELVTYFSRRRFLWICCDDNAAKTCRQRLKAWCADNAHGAARKSARHKLHE